MAFDLPGYSGLSFRPRRVNMSNASSVPLRSPMGMPMEEQIHGAMPTSPFDIDPRDPRMMSAAFESRLGGGIDGPDYFSTMGLGIGMGIGPFGCRGSGGGFPHGLDPEMMMSGQQQNQIDDAVRRTNLMVQFVNSQVTPTARYAQIQPKMCPDAKFPPEFRVPKTVEEVRAMDPSSIDRVLRAYGLPTDLRSLRLSSQDTISPRTAQLAKLCTLFDFLGATQISERQRKRTMLAY